MVSFSTKTFCPTRVFLYERSPVTRPFRGRVLFSRGIESSSPAHLLSLFIPLYATFQALSSFWPPSPFLATLQPYLSHSPPFPLSPPFSQNLILLVSLFSCVRPLSSSACSPRVLLNLCPVILLSFRFVSFTRLNGRNVIVLKEKKNNQDYIIFHIISLIMTRVGKFARNKL